ncbi:hypothetical protein [Microbulbifer sp. JMSA003]|uniref:hypothetical protein n=1 Tax=Microbulbifer sp. JMSA003 TaxID=3243369 RepID=UPI0040393D84
MLLIIKFLSGERTGKEILLDSGAAKTGESIPYILETEALQLNFSSEELLEDVKLLFDGVEYEFSLKASDDSTGYIYYLMPKVRRGGKGFEALFYNYFGVANFQLSFSSEGCANSITFPPVEILARKLTAIQAENMIEYIFTEGDGKVFSCFSPSSMGSRFCPGGNEPKFIERKVNQLLNILDEVLPYIFASPITRVLSDTRVVRGAESEEVGEQGIGWLVENLSVLEPSYDQEIYHLEYDDERYYANEIQTSITLEKSDVYENRVIHGFLQTLQVYINELAEIASSVEQRCSGNSHQGYVSFFSAMNRWVDEGVFNGGINSASLLSRVGAFISLARQRIPVTKVETGLPVVTQKAKGNRAYITVFRAVAEWYKNNRIDWTVKDFLLSIRSIPKLFEYYSVLKIKKALSSLCMRVNEDLEGHSTLFAGKYKSIDISMLYEPDYWMYAHDQQSGSIFNSEIRRFEKALRSNEYSPPNHKFSKRVPDIVISLEYQGENFLVILDAKYSSPKTSFEKYLPECTKKYVHGLSAEGYSPTLALVLISPFSQDAFADFHVPPFGLMEHSTAFPILGVHGVKIDATNVYAGSYSTLEIIRELLDSCMSHLGIPLEDPRITPEMLHAI